MQIDRLDHLVLTVASIEASVAFYTRVLGMREVTFELSHYPARMGRRNSPANRPAIP